MSICPGELAPCCFGALSDYSGMCNGGFTLLYLPNWRKCYRLKKKTLNICSIISLTQQSITWIMAPPWSPWDSAYFGIKHIIERLVHRLTLTTFVREILIFRVAVLQKMCIHRGEAWSVIDMDWRNDMFFNYWIIQHLGILEMQQAENGTPGILKHSWRAMTTKTLPGTIMCRTPLASWWCRVYETLGLWNIATNVQGAYFFIF